MNIEGIFLVSLTCVKVFPSDETLPIINKPKHPKRGNTINKMEGRTHEKTIKTPKKVNHKGNIMFLNPFPWQEAYQIRKGEDLLKGCLI
jgi:hypothetical protein